DALKALQEKEKEPAIPEPEPEPTTEVLFLCNYEGCGKTFIDAGALRKYSPIHEERQFICHYEGCGKKFLDRSKLKRHFLIHTRESDFICPHEGYGLKERVNHLSFVSTVDPLKEPPLIMANTVLSILDVDYPVDKYSIELRAPEFYFSPKIDYLKDKIKPSFVKERRAIKVFLGHTGAHDIEGNELPRLVYVSREKRPCYQHHKKAGAENAL
ncbi:hypothetical protein S83_023287, partial [Arachis hypogaea]